MLRGCRTRVQLDRRPVQGANPVRVRRSRSGADDRRSHRSAVAMVAFGCPSRVRADQRGRGGRGAGRACGAGEQQRLAHVAARSLRRRSFLEVPETRPGRAASCGDDRHDGYRPEYGAHEQADLAEQLRGP